MSASRTGDNFFPLNEMQSLPTTDDPSSYGEGYQPVRTNLGAVVTVSLRAKLIDRRPSVICSVYIITNPFQDYSALVS